MDRLAWVRKIPSLLFIVVQLALLMRFFFKLFIGANAPYVNILYDLTDIIVLPVRVILSFLKISEGILLESLFLATTACYIAIYTVISNSVSKVIGSEREYD